MDAIVWELCDGRIKISGIRLSHQLAKKHVTTPESVRACSMHTPARVTVRTGLGRIAKVGRSDGGRQGCHHNATITNTLVSKMEIGGKFITTVYFIFQ